MRLNPGAINVELTIESTTLLTMFFVIDGKGSYSLLLSHDWIHVNYCIPSTMHQCLIQWHGDDVELVHADESISVAEPPKKSGPRAPIVVLIDLR